MSKKTEIENHHQLQPTVVEAKTLPNAPQWLQDLGLILSKASLLVLQPELLPGERYRTANPILFEKYDSVLRLLEKIRLESIFSNTYFIDPSSSLISINTFSEVQTTGDYIRAVMEEIYRPLKEVVGHLQNGEHLSADLNYLNFFAELCEIKKQLEDCLFE